MMGILWEVGLDGQDCRIIGNLYWDQTAGVHTGSELSEEVKIQREFSEVTKNSELVF